MKSRYAVMLLALACGLHAQGPKIPIVPGGGTGTGNMSTTAANTMATGSTIDAAAATRTRPWKKVANTGALGACSVGDVAWVDTEPFHRQPWRCSATDTWVAGGYTSGDTALNFAADGTVDPVYAAWDARKRTTEIGYADHKCLGDPGSNPAAGYLREFWETTTCAPKKKTSAGVVSDLSGGTLMLPIDLPIAGRTDIGGTSFNSGWNSPSGGPVLAAFGTGTRHVIVNFTEAAASASAYITAKIILPTAWTGAAPTARLIVSTTNATPSGDAVFQMGALCVANAETMSGITLNTTAKTAVTLPATQYHSVAMTFTLPITGCAADEIMFVSVQRFRDDAADTTTQDVGVSHVQLRVPLSLE